MKRCAGCEKDLPLSSYSAHRRSSDGLQYRCKECCIAYKAAWYEKNKARHMSNVRRDTKIRAARNREYLLEYLTAHPCLDCGTTDIRVLEFDHRPGTKKYKNVSFLAANGATLTTLKAEVKKCDVRCRNCHAIVTFERAGGNWRTIAFGAAPL